MATQRQRPIEILTQEEVDALIGAASRRAPTGVRNRALIAMMYYGGLRIAEALALLPRDVDLKDGAVNIRLGKDSRQRIAGLNSVGVAHLELWLTRRKALHIGPNKPLFCSISKGSVGNPIFDAYVRAALSRLAKRAGITKRVHAHGLRHSHAHHLAKLGRPVNEIQGQLGHSSLATTGQYLDSIAPTARVQAIHDLDW